MKTIAVDLDDTLNDFTATLRGTEFPEDPDHPLADGVSQLYLDRIRSDRADADDLLVTEYSFFRERVLLECFRLAKARPGAVEFMQWLRAAGWQIVICTGRDLRRAGTVTRNWLDANAIPFDHLFMAGNKIVFCHAWGVPHLVDDDPFNIVHGPEYGVNVYYPVMDKHQPLAPGSARGFTRYDEVKRWIQE